jgi:hypothetical protein
MLSSNLLIRPTTFPSLFALDIRPNLALALDQMSVDLIPDHGTKQQDAFSLTLFRSPASSAIKPTSIQIHWSIQTFPSSLTYCDENLVSVSACDENKGDLASFLKLNGRGSEYYEREQIPDNNAITAACLFA